MADGPLIDWWVADRVAGAVAGRGPVNRIADRDLIPMAERSAEAVIAHTGLQPEGPIPAAETVDRDEWIGANLEMLRSVTDGLERQLGAAFRMPGPVGIATRTLAGVAAGAEIGLVSGYLAQRVLGQYDIALIGPERPARLLFVAPNLAEAQAKLRARRRDFLQWVALHEVTHAVQFAAVPWLRTHLGSHVDELLADVEASPGLDWQTLRRLLIPPDPRRLAKLLSPGELLRLVGGERRRELLDSLQTTMAVVEGYAEHVMDEAAGRLDFDHTQMRERMERRRAERSRTAALIGRLLGLDMKMRQYEMGKRFSDEVAHEGGITTLNLVWSEPSALPSAAELEDPRAWLRRVA